MIPAHVREPLAQKLYDKFGVVERIGNFLFTFSALDASRDAEYALDMLEEHKDDEVLCGAINMVLEAVTADYRTTP